MNLTAAVIAAAEPGDEIKDHVVAGLHVRVFENSTAFYLYYRTRSGRRRKPKIGEWPALSLPRARTIARGMLDKVASGGDPSRDRQEERTAPTVAALCDRYMIEHGARKKTASEDQRIIDRYILPKIGRERVAQIAFDDIDDLHKGIAARYQANRVLSLLSKAFNLCETWGWRPQHSNPCHGVRRHRERKRKRYASAEEMAAIAACLDKWRNRRPETVALIYLLIYTGARTSEIANAKWSDLHGNTLILDAHKTDGDGEARVVHLAPPAMEIIDSLPRTAGTITGVHTTKNLWGIVRAETGCADLRVHDLRHSYASAGLSAGLTLAQIGELLGHSSAETTKRYSHLVDEVARELAAKTAAAITLRSTPRASPD